MKFENIITRYQLANQRRNDPPEKVLDFEMHSGMMQVLWCPESFENGNRKVNFVPDLAELQNTLKRVADLVKTDIKYIENYRKELEKKK